MSSSRASRALSAAGFALAAAGFAGCVSLPDAGSIPTEGVEWIRTVAPGCEPPSAESALRQAVGDDPAALDFARRVGGLETVVTRRPMLAGNSVHLLVDGPATHTAQLDAIRGAKHHVHLEVYILTDEKIGQAYAEALAERARAGVKVRLMFDGVGALGAGAKYRDELRKEGVEIEEINSVNPLKEPRVWRLNRRSHRKLLVVDGRVAFTGGVNIMDEYSESSPGSAAGDSSGSRSSSGGGSSGSGGKGRPSPQLGWRDTHIQVEGPAVAEFQREFLRSWESSKGRIQVAPEYWPANPPRGDSLMRVVSNEGSDFLGLALGVPQELINKLLNKRKRSNPIYLSYFSAIQESQKRVWLTQAYFAPDDDFVDLLGDAAKRNVDVRLIVPGQSDVGLLPLAARHYYKRLLKAGVKLYEYEPVMIHAKTAVIDGVWSTVGSSNLDFRSFIHNDEANAIVMGRAFGQEMEALFEQDLSHSTQVTLEQWQQRPWLDRLKESGAAAVKYWI